MDVIQQRIKESIEVKNAIKEDWILVDRIRQASDRVIKSLLDGGKLILCGNGGSASDAMHFAGELVGRFQKERRSLPAIVLNSEPISLTAISNDYDYDEVIARQSDAFVQDKDIFFGISTSGNSENILRAMKKVKERGIYTIGLLGNDGGKIGDVADLSIIVPSSSTARIQESHIMIIHIICELIEEAITNNE